MFRPYQSVLEVRDLRTGAVRQTLKNRKGLQPIDVSISPDGRWLAVKAGDLDGYYPAVRGIQLFQFKKAAD